jgi:hypothetical protein
VEFLGESEEGAWESKAKSFAFIKKEEEGGALSGAPEQTISGW